MQRESDDMIFRRVKCEYSTADITEIWLQPDLNAAGYSGFQTSQTKCIGAQYYPVVTKMKTVVVVYLTHFILGRMEWPQSCGQDDD
jgi:hypothetical protein